MPQYLAPGVYIEETSFRSKSIEGVSTTMTGFIGPTRYGPVDLPNDLLTSVADFERVYGDRNQLEFKTGFLNNFTWHAARAFFTEGGNQLYVSRIFRRLDAGDGAAGGTVDTDPTMTGDLYNDGHARARLSKTADAGTSLKLRARWPGAYGKLRVRLTLRVGQNVLAVDRKVMGWSTVEVPRVSTLSDRDVVLITRAGSPPSADFYLARFDVSTRRFTFQSAAEATLDMTGSGASSLARGDQVQVIKASVAVAPSDSLGAVEVWEGLALDPEHQTSGTRDALTYVFGSAVDSPTLGLERQHARDKPIVIAAEAGVTDGLKVLEAFFAAAPGQVSSPPAPTDYASLRDEVLDPAAVDADRSLDVPLAGGNDGQLPGVAEYEGAADPSSTSKTGIKQFEDLDILSIIAAPGSSFNYESSPDRADAIIGLLIAHCEAMKYRIAVIDSGNDQSITNVQKMRARFDSSHAAFYYPWVRILDPVTRAPIFLPPSGFVAGIYARNDVNRAVYKVPANEVVSLSIGFESLLNKAQQDVLNPTGINCFRYFEGRGYRLWGGRTMSSDPEWKYVNLRRYMAYLEHSVDRGTQWAVFEPNGPHLWGNIRQTIADFLQSEFTSGALLGDKPEQAYFVRCDRSTMTQNDLDNGRLIVLVGVAVVKPAEFVIFRIGQWTANRS